MTEEIEEIHNSAFCSFWESNPLDPNEPTLIFGDLDNDRAYAIEFEKDIPFIARLSQEAAALLQAHPRGKEWMIREADEMFQREVATRLASRQVSYKSNLPWWKRVLGL